MPTRLAITPGEPAGIGPDLILISALAPRQSDWVVFASIDMLHERAALLGLDLALETVDAHALSSPTEARRGDALKVHDVPLAKPCTPAKPDPANSPAVLHALDLAIDACIEGRCDALVTAPMHKGVINDAGIAFSGHTEYLAERSGGHPVMLLTAEKLTPPLRVALATTHLPLREVAGALDASTIERVLKVLDHDLRERFGIDRPHILVAGVNPHAGEDGHLGREEIDMLIPLLNRLRAAGLNLSGPLPADTLFTHRRLSDADAVLAMYHDQGLPVLKHASFGQAVNVTLGLPIIRTSVDHGTAFDLVGTGRADTGSLHSALSLAENLAARRRARHG